MISRGVRILDAALSSNRRQQESKIIWLSILTSDCGVLWKLLCLLAMWATVDMPPEMWLELDGDTFSCRGENW
jgi:hypothetical protein